MAALADVFLRGRLDTSQIKGDAESGIKSAGFAKLGADSGKNFGESFSDAAKELISSVGGVIGVALGATEFLKGSLEAAREAAQVASLTNAVIKSTGGAANVTAGQVAELADQMSKKVGIDHDAIQSGENLLLTFTSVRNETGKGNDVFNQATQAAVDMSAALGQDLKSSVIQLGKALNDPITGMTALRRVGVSFNETQKETIKTLVATGDLMGAQKVILKEVQTEFGGAAAAIADPAKKAQVEWKDFEELIGGGVLSALNNLLSAMTAVGGPPTILAAAGVALLSNRIKAMSGDGGIFSDLKASWQLYSEAVSNGAPRITTALSLSSGALNGIKAAASSVVGLFGGPFGLAMTVATVGIGFLTQKMADSKAQTEAAIEAYRRFGDAVQESTSTTEVANLIKHDDAIQKLILDTSKYGISAKDVVAALAGQAQAVTSVNAQLAEQRTELVAVIAQHTQYGARTGPIMDAVALKAKAQVDQIDKLGSSFGRVAIDQKQAADAAGLYTESGTRVVLTAQAEAAAIAANVAMTTKLSGAVDALGKDYAPLKDVIALVTDKTISGKAASDAFGTTLKNIGIQAVPATETLSQYQVVTGQVGSAQLNATQKGEQFKAILTGIQNTAGPAGQQVDALKQVFAAAATSELTASDKATLLKQAWTALYQPAINQTDATQNFNLALLGLGKQIDKGSHSLDINKTAGINNRIAVEGLIQKNNDLYFANIAAGMSAVDAAKQHDRNGVSIEAAGRKAGLSTGEVRGLNNEYGKIPPAKNTNVTITGANAVYEQLVNLKIAQLALSQNIDVGAATSQIHHQMGQGIGGLKYGGPVIGPGTDTSDNLLRLLSPGEHVLTAQEVRAAGGHDNILSWRKMLTGIQPKAKYPGDGSAGFAFADGGAVYPFPVDVSHTRIPYTLKQLQDKFGGGDAMTFLKAQVGKPYIWDSAGPAGYDCSGIVSAIWNIIHKRSPYNHTFSTYNEAPFFPLGGVGGVLSAGWTNPGEPGPGGDSVGHTAGVLAGVPFESVGHGVGVRMGAGVTSIGRFAHIGHFDQGGDWPTGTLGINTSGRTEHVATGATMDAVVDRLDALICAVQQVAPGVGREVNSTGRSLVRMARAN